MQGHLAEARKILKDAIVIDTSTSWGQARRIREFLRAENQKWSKIARISGTKLD